PIGEFPVQISRARSRSQPEAKAAFIRIAFSEAPVAKWEMARKRGQEPLPVGVEYIYGFHVNSITYMGILMDKKAGVALKRSKKYSENFGNEWRKFQDSVLKFGNHSAAFFVTAGDEKL